MSGPPPVHTTTRYTPGVWQRAVRLVLDQEHSHLSQWDAIRSVDPPAEMGGKDRLHRRALAAMRVAFIDDRGPEWNLERNEGPHVGRRPVQAAL